MSKRSGYRWFVVAVFFLFMLLHQTDRLMIGSMQVPIMGEFRISDSQWGLVNTGALVVSTLLYPVWGYLYDRYARAKLLALASLIWGATTWLSSLVRSFPAFVGTRASTGIDDSSYPGLYSLVADYFGPGLRGRVYGLLQVAQPLGYLAGMVLALMVAPMIGGWRSVFYITGSLGLVIAVLIFFGVKEMPRGKAEPEFEGIKEYGQFRFSWAEAKLAVQKRSMWFVFAQGFAGVFPWNVITFFFFGYLIRERGYDNDSVLFTMAPVILVLALGYFVGGGLGDWLFKRTLNGRVIVSSVGVIVGAIFLFLAIQTPVENRTQFLVLMLATAVFMPFSSPNVIATIFDVTTPEVRSTTQAVEYFIENSGAAMAPLLAGIVADATDLKTAILWICISTWVLCFVIYLGALFFIPKDIRALRGEMQRRADLERAKVGAG
ncbi:MAG TPA: MFS transporter [Anaerolineales bacterium]|nr:MFS transporter [Anaerolineales bacterium]